MWYIIYLHGMLSILIGHYPPVLEVSVDFGGTVSVCNWIISFCFGYYSSVCIGFLDVGPYNEYYSSVLDLYPVFYYKKVMELNRLKSFKGVHIQPVPVPMQSQLVPALLVYIFLKKYILIHMDTHTHTQPCILSINIDSIHQY